jgi:hypothetical protein
MLYLGLVTHLNEKIDPLLQQPFIHKLKRHYLHLSAQDNIVLKGEFEVVEYIHIDDIL